MSTKTTKPGPARYRALLAAKSQPSNRRHRHSPRGLKPTRCESCVWEAEAEVMGEVLEAKRAAD